MLTIVIGNTKCKICDLTNVEVIKELDQQMSYFIQGHQFIQSYNNWDGRHRLFSKNHYFPIGLLSLALDIFKKYNLPYVIQDNREAISYGEPLKESSHNFEFRDYQEAALKTALQKGSGILKIATGAGKTQIITKLVGNLNIKTVVYVIGIELLYQMRDTFKAIYPDLEVGIIGDGHCDIKKITIATIWSAATAFDQKVKLLDSDLTTYSKSKDKLSNDKKIQIRELVNSAEMIVVDECQFCSTETFQLLHKESKAAKHRFLFSATPKRDDGATILVESIGGPIIYDLPASLLIEKGWLIPPKIYFLDIPPKRGIGKNYQEVYKNYIVDNDERNEIIVKSAKKLVRDNRKVLILVTNLQHGKQLLTLLDKDLRVFSLDGSNKTEDRLQAIRDMKNGKLDVLIASKIFDQGIDIPDLDALILAGSGKSSGRALQRIGRVIRKAPNKKDAIVIDFIDNCKYLKEHSQIRNKIYSSEPNFKIIMPKRKEE